MKLRLHEAGDEADDPLLSVVNLIDVFLVLIAALLLMLAKNPLNPLRDGQVTVIRNPGTPEMEVVVKDGARITRFKGDGASQPVGRGVKAGTAYRLPDGSLVYVPD